MDNIQNNQIRMAEAQDAPSLARLIDIAGEGIPEWLWRSMAEPNQTPLEFGELRAARETGGFSYRNSMVAECDGKIIGLLLGYVVATPDVSDIETLQDLPSPIRPFVELEHKSVGSFYINALAVFPGRRGAGVGRSLMIAAECRAIELGAAKMSIQVYSQNQGAFRLYEAMGYRQVDQRPVLWHPCQPYYDEDIVLMLKSLT